MTNRRLTSTKSTPNSKGGERTHNKVTGRVLALLIFILIVICIVAFLSPWAELFTNKEFYEYNDKFITDITEKGIEVDFLSGSEEYEGDGKDTVKTETRNYLLHLNENAELQVVFKSHLKNYVNCLSHEVWCYTYAYFVNGDSVQDIYEWANTNGLEIEPRLYY